MLEIYVARCRPRAMKSPTRGAGAGRASSHDTAGYASPITGEHLQGLPAIRFFLPRFALLGSIRSIFGTMPSKPFELPPAATRRRLADARQIFVQMSDHVAF
jgi:hypothetical protein